MSLLQMTGVSAGYGPVRVLHDLSLTVERGERIGLVGLNGHGKTTMLSTIVGLTGWQDGSILFEGQEIGGRRTHGMGRRTPEIVRRGIAMAPQGDAIFPGLTVRENLDSGAYTRDVVAVPPSAPRPRPGRVPAAGCAARPDAPARCPAASAGWSRWAGH